MQNLLENKQPLKVSGVGAHHQNGVAEVAIKHLSRTARTMLLHALLRWPDMIDRSLWRFCHPTCMSSSQCHAKLGIWRHTRRIVDQKRVLLTQGSKMHMSGVVQSMSWTPECKMGKVCLDGTVGLVKVPIWESDLCTQARLD